MTIHKMILIAISSLAVSGCSKSGPTDLRKPEQIQYDHAIELRNKNDINGTKAALDTALRLNKAFTPAYLELAEIEYKTGNTPKAIEYLETLRKAAPKEPHVLCRLADLRGTSGRFIDGFLSAKAALEAEPECDRAKIAYAYQLVSAGDIANARKLLLEVHKKSPENERAVLILGQLAIRDNSLGEAKGYLANIPAKSKWNEEANALRAELLMRSKDAKDQNSAKELLATVIKVYPNHVRANTLLGEIELEKKDPMKAMEHFSKAMTNSEPSYDVLIGIARAQKELKNPNAAKLIASAESYSKTVDKLYLARQSYVTDQTDKRKLIGLASISLQMGFQQDAQDLVNQVLKMDPNDIEALKMLAPMK